jgi:hypothetical protein
VRSWVGWGLVFAFAIAAVAAPRPVRRLLALVTSLLDRIARRRALAIGGCGALALAGSLAFAFLVKWPEPREHDEFSYLLAADTFAHGRLANPPHPMARFFETFHVLVEPTYASKYPPAQGLFLALGQFAGGHPIAGVWISAALMAAAICWMLYAFLPPRWALVGGLVAVAQLGVATYWTQSYWGGAVAALGGALVLGATGRILHGARVRDAILLATGVAILANSRPFEGLLAAVPCAIALCAWLIHGDPAARRRALARVVLPVAAVLVPVAAWMILYDVAVTGSPLRLPYAAYDEQFPLAPLFLWSRAGPEPEYRYEVIRQISEALHEPHRLQQTMSGFLSEARGKLLAFWHFFVGPQLSIALVAALPQLARPRLRLAAATVAAMLLAIFVETYYMHHYFAPMAGAIVLVLASGLRALAAWRPKKSPVGPAIAFGIVLAAFASIADPGRRPHAPPAEWRRSPVLADLERQGGRHLVVVRYGPRHVPNYEWVYNRADVDAAPVVWARDQGAANKPLLDWYPDRRTWLLEVGFDEGAPRLAPYPR